MSGPGAAGGLGINEIAIVQLLGVTTSLDHALRPIGPFEAGGFRRSLISIGGCGSPRRVLLADIHIRAHSVLSLLIAYL